MPLPFLVLGAAAVVGGMGVVGGLAAKETMDEAKKLGEKGDRLIASAKSRCEREQQATSAAIDKLGSTKVHILSNNMSVFLDSFRKLKNVEFKNSVGLDELRDFTPQSDQLRKLEQASITALDLSKGYGGGLAGGGITALGAYGAVGMLGTASTGTAIGTLGGAAATNATLAWLGGGSLATGGLGIAGGTAVLGGIVAAPALLVGAYFLNNKADEAMSKAKTHYAKAEEFNAKCSKSCSLLAAIRERGEQITNLLFRMDGDFSFGIRDMKGIIARRGTDWRSFAREEQEHIAAVAMTAKTLKLIIDAPLCREDGTLDPNSARVFSLPGVRG